MSQAKEKQVTEMFNAISKTYDQVNGILSFHIDKWWRRLLIDKLPKNTHRLLDIATGTGDVLIQAVRKKKAHSGIGIDLAEKMLEIGAIKAQKYKSQIEFKVGNALSLPFEENSFDATTISFGIRNVQDVKGALSEMKRVLKPGGRSLILEFSLPKNSGVRALHLFYLRKVLPKVGGFFSKKKDSYEYLNQTIEKFPYGEDFLTLMQEAGFNQPRAKPLLFGIATLYWADK